MRKKKNLAKKRLVATYLKKKRMVADLSQKEVARELGYKSAQFISNWERGVSQPPLTTLSKLVGIYRLPRGELVDLLVRDFESELKRHFS